MQLTALVTEAARKSRVCWLSWSGAADDKAAQPDRDDQEDQGPRLVWHAWYDDALLVLSGDDQVLTGLDSSPTAEVVMRSKDTGGRLVTWTASVEVVPPSSEAWDAHAAALLAVRLNLPDPAAARERWRESATVLRLAPVDATEDQDSGPLP